MSSDSVVAIFGHSQVRQSLEAYLPPVTLLQGPASVGKWTLCEHLINYYDVQSADCLLIDYPEPNSTHPAALWMGTKESPGSVRRLVSFVSTAPMGNRKVVVARLDRATDTALNFLLKTLEETPSYINYLLTTVEPTSATIVSRSHVYRMGFLSKSDLFDVLTEALDMPPGIADRASLLGGGQVQVAIDSSDQDNARAAVLGVLKAVKDGDIELLEFAAGSFDYYALVLMHRWLVEAITGRWNFFSSEETFDLAKERQVLGLMLTALSANVRPKLIIRSGLDSIVRSRRGAGI